jgi:hypothetical protein
VQLTHSSERQPRWRIGYVRTYGEVSSKPRHNDGSIPLHTAIGGVSYGFYWGTIRMRHLTGTTSLFTA